MSGLDLTLEPERVFRRIEVITGEAGRRRWTADAKARIVAETLEPGAVVSEVARRHGLRPQQLFAWRRASRQPIAAEPLFVPALVEPPVPPARRRRHQSGISAIELEIDGVLVRVGQGACAATLTAVIRALKAGS